ncbi:MAG TPA: sigma-70 family RNA polymerase sigma factor [Acidimicrobiia bacterium]|jgi:RNA polymerase sigma-70 factor (ECF subfamily)|nr:sigma-70 family RNA polymerase sigma factor [Acidimicrobiia bacterium]
MMAVDTGEIPVVRLHHTTFEAFYRQNRQHLFRALALTLGDRDLAAEAADEAMARAYQHWRTVQTYDNQAGWTYRVGLNWARSRLRKRQREILAEVVPEASTEIFFSDPDLDRAVKSLPVDSRAVVVLRHYLDWSTDEVARVLQIRPGTVKSRLHRAMQELRDRLEMTQ